jgi:phosphatidylserine/phosphatidylglycerophosphate/cardiolipin synthase-like enzyme
VRRAGALFAILAALPVPVPASPAAPAAGEASGTAQVEVAFTPGDDVARLIVRHVDRARENVRMQAYLFTHKGIARALAAAAKRGVAVEIVADAKQYEAGGLPVLKDLARGGARIWINDRMAASHNKVIIIDAATVITGSYNFTQAAQAKNAENVVVLSGNPAIAARFAANFERHRREASRLQ